jgi:cytochrome c2
VASDLKTERWPKALLAFLVAAGVGLFVFQLQRERWPDWKSVQSELARKNLDHPRLGTIVEVRDDCTGQTDRCLTCHVGKDSAVVDREVPARDIFFEAHAAQTAVHFQHHRGCSACHGGQGRALSTQLAHLQPLESQRSANRLYLQAACTRCHVAGSAGTEKVASGASLFLKLGCQMCHPLDENSLSGWDFGPRLNQPGLRSLAKLRQSIIDPAADFEKSTMPSFAGYFRERQPELEDLLAFLLTLSQQPASCNGPRTRADLLAAEACTLCHQEAENPAGPPHRCLYLRERAGEISCQNCHHGSLAGKEIPSGCVLESHRPHCRACHRGGSK